MGKKLLTGFSLLPINNSCSVRCRLQSSIRISQILELIEVPVRDVTLTGRNAPTRRASMSQTEL
jgi:hypothetical protein